MHDRLAHMSSADAAGECTRKCSCMFHSPYGCPPASELWETAALQQAQTSLCAHKQPGRAGGTMSTPGREASPRLRPALAALQTLCRCSPMPRTRQHWLQQVCPHQSLDSQTAGPIPALGQPLSLRVVCRSIPPYTVQAWAGEAAPVVDPLSLSSCQLRSWPKLAAKRGGRAAPTPARSAASRLG